MIYFTCFAKMKKYPNMEFFSISENIPNGLNIPVIIELVPCSTLIRAFKKEQCSQDDFRKNYFRQISTVNRLKIGNMLQDKCIVCDRPLGIFSHSQFVAEWLKSVGFEIEELK